MAANGGILIAMARKEEKYRCSGRWRQSLACRHISKGKCAPLFIAFGLCAAQSWCWQLGSGWPLGGKRWVVG